MQKEFLIVPLFEQFLRDNCKGKRLKRNGQRIRVGTTDNYANTLKLIREFEKEKQFILRVRILGKADKRQLIAEKNYWKKLYSRFSQFLYSDKGCYDNYAGSIMKVLRSFFIYLCRDKQMMVGEFYKNLYVQREEIDIVTLQPKQFRFLISDRAFETELPPFLKRTKDFFVFGCTVALRFSDLQNIRMRDIGEINGFHYLFVRSIKTNTVSRIKLPSYAVDIIRKYGKRKVASSKIFDTVCLRQFNKNLQAIGEKAGWTEVIGKRRRRNGQVLEIYKDGKREAFRFCDLLTSHLMRRTAITTMLMSGVPEHIVRKISGHSANSTAFYRYVNYTQSYLDKEIDKMHEVLSIG